MLLSPKLIKIIPPQGLRQGQFFTLEALIWSKEKRLLRSASSMPQPPSFSVLFQAEQRHCCYQTGKGCLYIRWFLMNVCLTVDLKVTQLIQVRDLLSCDPNLNENSEEDRLLPWRRNRLYTFTEIIMGTSGSQRACYSLKRDEKGSNIRKVQYSYHSVLPTAEISAYT